MKLLMKQGKVIEFEVGANGMKKEKNQTSSFWISKKRKISGQTQNVTLNMKD